MDTEAKFTETASKMISDEKEKFEKDLRKKAVEQALIARGEPVEITASDVKVALKQVIGEPEPAEKSPFAASFRFYTGGGGLLVILGSIYPAWKYSYLSNAPVDWLSLTVTFIGFGVMCVGLAGDKYLKTKRKRQLRKLLHEQNKSLTT